MHGRLYHPTDTRRRDRQSWSCLTWRLTAALALGLTLALPLAAQAKTFRCGAGDVACLIAAINAANANGEANTIRLAAGTYTLTEADNDPPSVNANGLPVITSPLTITGRGADTTIIERDASAEAFRILEVATTGTLTLKRLTLRGGVTSDGGGILNHGMLTLVRTTVADNTVSGGFGGGGGIAHYGTTLTITHSTIENNVAPGGGGIRIGPFFLSEDPVGIARVATITATSITRNAAGAGGGISTNNGTVIITTSAISENTVSDDGGGILIVRGIMEITNTTIAANFSDSPQFSPGDGIATLSGTLLLLLNSTVAENRRPLMGGGFAQQNIGIRVSGTVLLQNTIVTGHNRLPPPFARGGDCIGPVTTLGNNLIGDPTGCTIIPLPSDLTGDPGFGPFTDNGRPGNGHFPLLPTSQAIDAGNDALCPRTDQLGRRRIGPCDIGAIEFRERDDDQHDEEDDKHDREHDDTDPVAAAQAAP